jgi:hypothetical protein
VKHAALFLFGSLILVLNSSAAHGQGCATTLSPHFSVYTSVSRNGNNIYTSVTMQGYASVFPGPGCNMNAATHHVGAENKLNNVDHWTYSANGCPTCYFSATNNEQIVGVPGVVYPWVWDGQAICSMVGSFFNGGGSGSITGCLAPSTEATDDQGFNGSIFRELFKMTISDTAADSFDSHYVEEYTVTPGTNTCWWSNSGLPQNPGVSGGSWTVGTYSGVAAHNQWGPDAIGWNLSDLDNIVQNGPRNGVTFPCVATIHQGMKIECNANLWYVYSSDDITITVDNHGGNTEEVCRAGECGLEQGFADRWIPRRTEWARILATPQRSSPRPTTVTEAK